MRLDRRLVAAALAASLFLLGGCGDPKIKQADLERQVGERVEEQSGVPVDNVQCPKDLKGKVGESLQCTVVASDGVEAPVTVTVTEVEGDTVNYDVQTAN